MSVSWEPCQPEETERVLQRLNDQFAGQAATEMLIAVIQNTAGFEGYRLNHLRYETTLAGDRKVFGIVCDSIDRMRDYFDVAAT